MTQGGPDRDPWAAPRWLRLEGLLAAALRVSWQHEPPVVAGPADDAKDSLDRLCSALSTSNAFAFAWQALGVALIEPELRNELADTELLDLPDDPELRKGRSNKDLLDKLDAVLAVAPSVSAVFEHRLRWTALHDLRAMLDSAVILPPVHAASLPQWWSKSTGGLVGRAAEHLALQLDVVGMASLANVLRAPASPAFAFLAAYMAQHIRRQGGPSREFLSTEAPSLLDRWVSELYVAARIVGRYRSDIVARSMSDEERIAAQGPYFPLPLRNVVGTETGEGPTSEPPTVPRPVLRQPPAPPDASTLAPAQESRRRLDPIVAAVSAIAAISALTVGYVGYQLRAVSSDEVPSPTPPGATVVTDPAVLAPPTPPVMEEPATDEESCARAINLAAEGDFVQANSVFASCSVERFETGADISRHAQKAVAEHLAQGDCDAAHAVIDAIGDVGVMLEPADERRLDHCRQSPASAPGAPTPLDPR